MPGRRVVLGAALLSPFFARAQDSADPARAAAFVRQAGAELGSVVAGATSPADRRARLAGYLDRVVDVDGLARFCLGRFWQTATPEQQTEYVSLFHQVLLLGVVNRLGTYQSDSTKIVINQPQIKPDGVNVPTIVDRPGNKPVSITWLVTQVAGTPRIADVVAEGMSLRMTQRSDYASFLVRNKGDVGALIAAMRERVAADLAAR